MALIKKLFQIGALGLSLALAGCGGEVSDSYVDPLVQAQTAINYVDGQLQAKGYVTERNIEKLIINIDNGYPISHNYDLHATNSGTGDEQFWEAELLSADMKELSASQYTHSATPHITFLESTEYDTPTLDAKIDYNCTLGY